MSTRIVAPGPTRLYRIAAAVALLAVLVGFAPSFYLKFVFQRPPALTVLLVVHGVVMTAWFALFVVQAQLAASRNLRLHRRLGTGGVALAAAVLVRGVEPVEGILPGERTDGPGRLCRVLGLNLNHNGLKLDSGGLHLLPGTPVPEARVERGPRIGVEYAGAWAAEPLRLWDRDSGHVSRFVSRRPRRRP